jgi:type IV pilus assembly protein PilC
MAIFNYRARKRDGGAVNGAVVAPTQSVAYNILKDRDLIIIALSERKEGNLFKSPMAFFKRVKIKEQVIFARQLAVMISANVPIVKALKILVRQTENKNFKTVISDVLD